jgi:hypothetical protein
MHGIINAPIKKNPWIFKIKLDDIECEVEVKLKMHDWLGKISTTVTVDGEEETPPNIKKLWDILAKVYDFYDETAGKIDETKVIYGEGILKNNDSVWQLYGLFPMSMNFGDLDYSSSSICDIEITWMYKKLERI